MPLGLGLGIPTQGRAGKAAGGGPPPATAPDAPTIGTATSDGTSQTAVVSFTPGYDGGSPVTTYTVTSSPGGIQATGASSPITVTGLTNNTDYTFTVTATNVIGTSAPSSASNSVRVESLGPEMAPAWDSGSWTVVSGTGVSVDANGVHFVNASNIATVGHESAAIVPDVTYKVVHTVSNVGSPNSVAADAGILLYANVTNKVASIPNHTPIGTGGTYTDYVTTTASGTATTTAIRVRCDGTTGNNNFDVSYLSVRQVL